jgi:transcriptional regulator with XRE-family HTH domain
MCKKHKNVSALAGRLLYERNKRNWTQAYAADELEKLLNQMGRRCNIYPETIGHWERGERHPKPHYRQGLCLLYGISEDECTSLINEDF